jgi:nitrogen regulatory protein PII
MKKIEATIRPSRMYAVREALAVFGINEMTIVEVGGSSRRNGQPVPDINGNWRQDFQPKIKLEFVVDDAVCGPVCRGISHAAGTGGLGDGNIFISQVEEAIRIRADEADQLAVC